MASVYEINQVAVKVRNAISAIDQKRSAIFKEVRDSAGWWSGAASNTFIQEYAAVNNEVVALTNTLASLEQQLKYLAVAIAESEALVEE